MKIDGSIPDAQSRLLKMQVLEGLHLSSPFRLDYEFHDEDLYVLRLINWPAVAQSSEGDGQWFRHPFLSCHKGCSLRYSQRERKAMLHEQLDIVHWKTIFAVPRLREVGSGKSAAKQPEAVMISGPYDIAVVEQLREESGAALSDVERVATNVFVWNRGESNQRAVTKIGGLPYREAGKLWPTAPSGTPMSFVAQFCFVDSFDLLPPLLGNILLIFIEGKEWRFRDQSGYHFMWGEQNEDKNSAITFEWVTLHTRTLITNAEIPKTQWQILPCYGTIYRTWDYPTVDGFEYPEVAEHIPEVLEATKIGGVCPYKEEVEMIWAPRWGTGGISTYLCTLSSISFGAIDAPFSFLNVPEPISVQERLNSSPLLIGDAGLMNFFLDSSGTVRWSAHH